MIGKMKAIMISIKPEWNSKILNLEKILEIRTTCPKEWKDYLSGKISVKPEPIKVYNYCTFGDMKTNYMLGKRGKVVAEFTLNEVERFDVPYPAYFYQVQTQLEHIVKGSCLPLTLIHNYLKNNSGYAWHIDDLKIYDEPKELSEFRTAPSSICDYKCKYKERKMNLFSGCTHDMCSKHHCQCFVKITRQNECDEYERVFESKKLTKPPQSWCYVEGKC